MGNRYKFKIHLKSDIRLEFKNKINLYFLKYIGHKNLDKMAQNAGI